MNPCKLCHNLTTQVFRLSSVPKSICSYCAKQISEQYIKKINQKIKVTNEKS